MFLIIKYRNKKMPIIRVDMLKGRTKKQKQNLVKELTQAFNRACGENHVGIDVILYEVEKENWSINGQLFSEKQSK
ncbi:2-hydroxymuconate tautomerase family protein [SAR116 cluster bacterium]|mgnify:FL=1|nr:2-hydroxymuconate tautomerase family protein [SAR116 cluster bacterium]